MVGRLPYETLFQDIPDLFLAYDWKVPKRFFVTFYDVNSKECPVEWSSILNN